MRLRANWCMESPGGHCKASAVCEPSSTEVVCHAGLTKVPKGMAPSGPWSGSAYWTQVSQPVLLRASPVCPCIPRPAKHTSKHHTQCLVLNPIQNTESRHSGILKERRTPLQARSNEAAIDSEEQARTRPPWEAKLVARDPLITFRQVLKPSMDEPLKDFTQHWGEREGAKSRGSGFRDERNQCVSPGERKRRLQEHPVVKVQKKDPRSLHIPRATESYRSENSPLIKSNLWTSVIRGMSTGEICEHISFSLSDRNAGELRPVVRSDLLTSPSTLLQATLLSRVWHAIYILSASRLLAIALPNLGLHHSGWDLLLPSRGEGRYAQLHSRDREISAKKSS